MVDKLKDVAMLFKAKITRDQTQELLIQATSEDNWQTPTPILHQIVQASNDYQQWKKISLSVFEKLKQKKWRKVLKTLNLIQFLLKNGSPHVIPTIRNELYTFKGFQSFSCFEDGMDRGQSIRQKAKAVLELITNNDVLQEQRTKAYKIKQKLFGNVDTYQTKSNVYGSPNTNQNKSKYQSFGSDLYNNNSKTPKNTGNNNYFDNNLNDNTTKPINQTASLTQSQTTFQKIQQKIGKTLNINKQTLLQNEKQKNIQIGQPSIFSNDYKPPVNNNNSQNLTKKISIEQSPKKIVDPNKKPTNLFKNLNIKGNSNSPNINNNGSPNIQIKTGKNNGLDLLNFEINASNKSIGSQKQLPGENLIGQHSFSSQKQINYQQIAQKHDIFNGNNNLFLFDNKNEIKKKVGGIGQEKKEINWLSKQQINLIDFGNNNNVQKVAVISNQTPTKSLSNINSNNLNFDNLLANNFQNNYGQNYNSNTNHLDHNHSTLNIQNPINFNHQIGVNNSITQIQFQQFQQFLMMQQQMNIRQQP